jgi:hypothetical protein
MIADGATEFMEVDLKSITRLMEENRIEMQK